MRTWILQLDELLRGERTQVPAIQQQKLDISTPGLAVVIVVLAGLYGLCMGSFAMARALEAGDSASVQQGLLQTSASMIKMPMLFLSTLFITFPSLYVFSSLVGSRLQISQVLKLLVAALGVNLAVLASLGPIVAFFSISTPNYHFVLLLNVFCCVLAGMLGLGFLLQTLYRMTNPGREVVVATEGNRWSESPIGAEAAEHAEPGPLRKTPPHVLGPHVKKVFWIWLFVFGLVGAQMGWVLRPFIGKPGQPFTWFRQRDSSFFESVWNSFQGLLG